MEHTLKPLPYSLDALEPHMSRETLTVHYEKHHAGYVKKLNELITGKPEAKATLEWLIRTAEGPIFDNAAQVWNHDFFWRSMDPDGGGAPEGDLTSAITTGFGGVEAFRRDFIEMGGAHFGSGWIWLVAHGSELRLATTPDADLPLRYGDTPLFCADLWEHAYYLDYKNERPKYLETFFDRLVNWEFAQTNWANAARSAPVLRRAGALGGGK